MTGNTLLEQVLLR